MKRFLLFSLAFIAGVAGLTAQNRLITDFGDTQFWRNCSSWGSTNVSYNAQNPQKDAVNQSDSVGQFMPTANWGAFAIQKVEPAFNIYSFSKLQFKAYITKAGTLTCRVDNDVNYSSTITGTFVISDTDINTWKVFELSMEGKRDINYNNIQFGYDNMKANVYLDDITLLNIPTTVDKMTLYTQSFGGYSTFMRTVIADGVTSYFAKDASLYIGVAGGGWGSGATVSGKAYIDWSGITSNYTSGTALKVTSDIVGDSALTFSDIDITGFNDCLIKFGFGHKQYWENPAIATDRPVISWKVDDGAWVQMTDADVSTETVWPTTDGEMNLVTINTKAAGSKLAIRIEASALVHIIDNMEVSGTLVKTGIDNHYINLPLQITNNEIIATTSVTRLEIYSMNGGVINSVQHNQINISQLTSGAYLVKAYSPEGIAIKKFIK